MASPAISAGTGDAMAKCVFNKVNEFGLLDEVEAAASNTGK